MPRPTSEISQKFKDERLRVLEGVLVKFDGHTIPSDDFGGVQISTLGGKGVIYIRLKEEGICARVDKETGDLQILLNEGSRRDPEAFINREVISFLDRKVNWMELERNRGPEIPEKVYVSFEKDLALVALTIPSLTADLQMSPSLERDDSLPLVVTFKNNGRWCKGDRRGLSLYDYEAPPCEIESITLNGQEIKPEDVIADPEKYLQMGLESLFGGSEDVKTMSAVLEGAGVKKGSYLYRAIGSTELRKLKEKPESPHFVAFNRHPTTNFESQRMFDGEHSQAKRFARDGEYSGHIVRFKIAHPMLYRPAGMAPPRIIPTLAHHLPREIEISDDGGDTFQKLTDYDFNSNN